MENIIETFKLPINQKLINIVHHCKVEFKNQQGKPVKNLEKLIISSLENNIKNGLVYYDNGECSIEWKLI